MFGVRAPIFAFAHGMFGEWHDGTSVAFYERPVNDYMLIVRGSGEDVLVDHVVYRLLVRKSHSVWTIERNREWRVVDLSKLGVRDPS